MFFLASLMLNSNSVSCSAATAGAASMGTSASTSAERTTRDCLGAATPLASLVKGLILRELTLLTLQLFILALDVAIGTYNPQPPSTNKDAAIQAKGKAG